MGELMNCGVLRACGRPSVCRAKRKLKVFEERSMKRGSWMEWMIDFLFSFCGGLWAARGHNAPQIRESKKKINYEWNEGKSIQSTLFFAKSKQTINCGWNWRSQQLIGLFFAVWVRVGAVGELNEVGYVFLAHQTQVQFSFHSTLNQSISLLFSYS